MTNLHTKNKQQKLDQIAKHFTAQAGFEKTLTEYKTKEILRFSKGRRILDIGCGEGLITEALAKKHKEVVGIDGSPMKIKMAKNISRTKKTNYQVAMLETYNAKEKFDCVVAANVLEHVQSPSALLRKAHQLLRKRGRIIVTVPNALSLHKRIGKHLGLIKSFYRLTPDDVRKGHRRIYNRVRLERQILQAGFKITHSGGIFLKPLSHKQMASWEKKLCDALYAIGQELPDDCSSLIVVGDK